MGTKKLILTFIFALTLIGLFPLSSSAAPGWWTVTVKQIGPASDGRIYVMLTDTQWGYFTNQWFVCNADTETRQMAVILTAMTNDLPIQIYADASQSEISNRIIINMYMYSGSN
jgi:hypothetical protein